MPDWSEDEYAFNECALPGVIHEQWQGSDQTFGGGNKRPDNRTRRTRIQKEGGTKKRSLFRVPSGTENSEVKTERE